MATTNNRLLKLKQILNEFSTFIEPYRTILNNHNVQFLVDDHWSKFTDFDENLVKSLENLTIEHKNLIRYSLNIDTSQEIK
jgi:hypothetical protein